jgi:tRNA pseudouridine55 synthase
VTTVATAGLVVVDKPAGLTSHDVVARLRRLIGTRRVGHAGTLDPMATGVLVAGIDRGTKLLGHLAGGDKSYRATIRLGQATTTDDAEGDVLGADELGADEAGGASADDVDDARIRALLNGVVGEFDQVPSSVSAVKVDGRRAYARVRAGETVELAARRVSVARLDLLAVRRPAAGLLDVDVDLDCSSGTYVRAIARDLGAELKVGGHLTALRRTRVGVFDLGHAATLEELAEAGASDADPVRIGLDAAVAMAFDRRDVDGEQARVLGHGGALEPWGRPGPYGVFGPDGRVIALMAERDGAARPVVVLRPA